MTRVCGGVDPDPIGVRANGTRTSSDVTERDCHANTCCVFTQHAPSCGLTPRRRLLRGALDFHDVQQYEGHPFCSVRTSVRGGSRGLPNSTPSSMCRCTCPQHIPDLDVQLHMQPTTTEHHNSTATCEGCSGPFTQNRFLEGRYSPHTQYPARSPCSPSRNAAPTSHFLPAYTIDSPTTAATASLTPVVLHQAGRHASTIWHGQPHRARHQWGPNPLGETLSV